MNELASFHREIAGIYGHYIQTRFALLQFYYSMRKLVDGPGPITGPSPFSFGPHRDPNLPDASKRYETTAGNLIAASEFNGSLHTTLRRNVVVLIVASWEDGYRGPIANELGLDKIELTSDVFHDLNKYRNAILHASGELRSEPKVLNFFSRRDQVHLTHEHLERIFEVIVDDLNRIGREYYNSDPKFVLDIPLNN